MTTKQQQQHVSRFLEASLLRQAEGKLKNLAFTMDFRVKLTLNKSGEQISHFEEFM